MNSAVLFILLNFLIIMENIINKKPILIYMAKKEEKEGSLKSFLESELVEKLKEGGKALIEEVIHKGQDIVYQTERKIIDNMIVAVVLLVGIIMIVLALAFFLVEVLQLTKYASLLIIGLVLIIGALIFKRKIDKTKYYNLWR